MKRFLFSLVLYCAGNLVAQTLPLEQSFEQSITDTWNFTTNPAAFNSGGDIWDRVNDGGQYLSPAPHGDFFWMFYDIDTIPGIPDDKTAHLTFETVDLTGEDICTLTFSYCNRGLDSADYMSYTIMTDNSNNWPAASEILLPKHSGDPAAWHTVSISLPAQADYCRLRLSAKADYSADCGGFDCIRLVAGDPLIPGLTIVTPPDGSFQENAATSIAVSGMATNITGEICWSNALNSAHGTIAATSAWSIAAVPLTAGRNSITVSATNLNGIITSDTITVDRAHAFPATAVGSLAFTAFNSAGDSFSFAALADIPAGTQIRFTDEEWSGVDFGTGEDDLLWSSTAAIAAGTIVAVTNCHDSTSVGATAGEIVSGRLILAQTSEGIIAYYGETVRQPTAFIAAISTATENIAGTCLAYGENAVDIATVPASQYYSGPRSGEICWRDYLPLINNPANWSATQGQTESWGDNTPFSRLRTATLLLVQ